MKPLLDQHPGEKADQTDPIEQRITLEQVANDLEVKSRVTIIQFSALNLTNKIASGKDGIVYRALWGRGEMPVAVKRLVKLELHPNNRKVLAKFQQESEILSTLGHPNLIKFFGLSLVQRQDPVGSPSFGTTQSPSVFLVTELCHASLVDVDYGDECRRSGRLMGLVQGIVSGMSYLHSPEIEIVHRDLKPANVLVNEEHTVAKICDFGLASVKLVTEDDQSMSVMVGTPAYMAPELITTRRPSFSNKVDVYSFGVMLWGMWCRKTPYSPLAKGTTAFMVMTQIANGLRLDIPSDMPTGLATLIRDCWDPIPHNRPSFPQIKARIARSKDGLGMHQGR
jgi:serine/threonine protein kinase